MSADPHLEHRAERPYLGIPIDTSMDEEAEVIAARLAELRDWMRSRQIAATGPPFVRYRQIERPHRLAMEVCLPVEVSPPGDGRVRGNAIPEGRYAVLVHEGPLDGLVEANARLQRWAAQRGLQFLTKQSGSATDWTSRIETYLTDSRTEIAYLVKV